MKASKILQFTKPTEYCNFNHPAILDVANRFKIAYPNKTELATKLFYFVRDTTVYRVGNWNKKASETLSEKGGTCTNNANLFVALLRAVNIPAGYGVMDVLGPEYFGPIVLPHLARNVSLRSKHIYCFVYLDGKWIKCDPSDDEPLSINTHHLNPQSRTVEWNGLSDAMLNLNPNHILKNRGPIADIDNIIKKKMRRRRMIPVFIGNLYIQFLREEGKKVSHIKQLKKSFSFWLLRKNAAIYIFYETFFFFESIIRKVLQLNRNKYA